MPAFRKKVLLKEKKKRIEQEKKDNPAAKIPKNENEFNQAMDSIENLFTKKFDFSKAKEDSVNTSTQNSMSVDQDGLNDASSMKQQLKNKKLKEKKKSRKQKTVSKKDSEWEDVDDEVTNSVNTNAMKQDNSDDEDEDDGIIRPGMGASLSKISKPKKISKGRKREKKKHIERALAYQERKSNQVVKKLHKRIKGLS